jgi:hypothetical protein
MHTQNKHAYWFQCYAQSFYSKSANWATVQITAWKQGHVNKGELLPHLFFAFFGHVRMFGDQYLCADGQVHITVTYIC